MGMKLLFLSLTLILSSSCIDFDRSKHLKEIDVAIDALKKSASELETPIFDSIPIVLSEIKWVNQRIRTYIKQDTLSIETALKIDEYKQIESQLILISEQIPVTQKDINSVTSDLILLKKDISNNSGDRALYTTNLAAEKENQKILIGAVERYTTTCRSSFKTFQLIHDSINEFSNHLELKNKEQNLIP